mmetsp:Transcript_19768/g.59731  ORF Transcript_19768/g.59731 Transcript_19768/m.59731 type:complete len:388 (+) Transcript_19768:830-1993(+)
MLRSPTSPGGRSVSRSSPSVLFRIAVPPSPIPSAGPPKQPSPLAPAAFFAASGVLGRCSRATLASERSSPPVTELRRPFSFRREPMEEMERARRWPPFFPSFPSFSAVPATAAGAAGAGKCCCCCWCCSCCCCCCIETSSCAETRCDAAKGEADAIEDGWLEWLLEVMWASSTELRRESSLLPDCAVLLPYSTEPAPRSGGLAGAGAAAGAARLKGFHCRPTGASVPLFARGTTSRASPPLALGATADVGRSFPPLPPSFPPDFSLRPAPSSTSKVGTAADTGRRRPMGRPVLCVRCIETGAACAEVSEELGASLSIVLSAFFLRRLKERKSPAPREGASGNGACPPFCCGDSSACSSCISACVTLCERCGIGGCTQSSSIRENDCG